MVYSARSLQLAVAFGAQLGLLRQRDLSVEAEEQTFYLQRKMVKKNSQINFEKGQCLPFLNGSEGVFHFE